MGCELRDSDTGGEQGFVQGKVRAGEPWPSRAHGCRSLGGLE